jgi:hypothetical protein
MKKASDSWGRLFPVGFALAWIGVFSVLWIHIKMSSQFGSIAAFGVSWPWPGGMIYVTAIYVVAMAAIVWIGLSLHLALAGSLTLRRFSLGASVGLLAVVVICVGGMLLPGAQPRALWVNYLIFWLPMLITLLLSMWTARA